MEQVRILLLKELSKDVPVAHRKVIVEVPETATGAERQKIVEAGAAAVLAVEGEKKAKEGNESSSP